MARDYRAEYQRRIAAGQARGRSVSESRGHGAPKTGFDRKLQSVVRDIEHGRYKSATQAAAKTHVPVEKLRNYMRSTGQGYKEGNRIVYGAAPGAAPPRDTYHVPVVSDNQIFEVDVSRRTATYVGQYMSAVGEFIRTGRTDGLKKFEGKTVTDVHGQVYELETDPEALTDIYSFESVDWDEIYRRNG